MNPTPCDDIIGKQFGRLVVVSRSDKLDKQGGKAFYECSCSCGGTKVVRKLCLMSGNTRSCGCLTKEANNKPHHIDITGQRFGNLVAIKRSGRWEMSKAATSGGGCKKAVWECKCDCGSIVNVRGVRLRNGRTTSCGCSSRSIRIDGLVFFSILEAAYYLGLKRDGIGFKHDLCYPGSRMRFDFYLPGSDTYVEVSSFDRGFFGWDKYEFKMCLKRRYVEDVLGAKFEFVNRKPTASERVEVLGVGEFLRPKGGRHKMMDPRTIQPGKIKGESYWKSVDWSKDDSIVAIDSGYSSLQTIAGKRRLFAPVGMRAWDLTLRDRWSGVDWSLSNRRLARELGRTVGAVSAAKARLGIANLHAASIGAS